jgi:ABC-type sulfate transport system permease subunit
VLGEFGGVIVVSGNIAGRTQTLTLFISDSIENLNPVGAYAGAVILALLSLVVLVVLGKENEGRKHRWRSRSEESPSDLEELSLSTTSASMSPTAP